jgi:hypothetical protein
MLNEGDAPQELSKDPIVLWLAREVEGPCYCETSKALGLATARLVGGKALASVLSVSGRDAARAPTALTKSMNGATREWLSSSPGRRWRISGNE